MSYPIYTSHNELFEAIDDELRRARGKFASSRGAFAALVEEVGELADELLAEHSPCDPAKVRAEAIQVAVMAIRIATEGDPELDRHAATLAALLGNTARMELARRYPETKKPSGEEVAQ